jgi:hypothetical protein
MIPDFSPTLAALESTFLAECATHDIVPLAIEIHSDSLTPVSAFERFSEVAEKFRFACHRRCLPG